jgi:hypothetical protein
MSFRGCVRVGKPNPGSQSLRKTTAKDDPSKPDRCEPGIAAQREWCCHLLPCVACDGGVLSTALVIRWSAAAVRRSVGSPILFPSVSHQLCCAASMA